jgi:MFS family permease
MKDSSFSRWMGPVGLLGAVLIFIGLGPLGGNLPGENASGVTVAHYLNTHVAQDWASIYFAGVGAGLLALFLVHVRTVLASGTDNRLFPNLNFAASILFLGGFLMAGSFQVILFLAAHNHQYAIVQTMNFASNNDELALVFGMALITLSAGLAILLDRRAGSLPRTLGWYSLLVAAVAVLGGPLSGLAFLFGLPIWVIATGFVISTKARRGTLGPSDDGGTSVAAPAGAAVAA